MSDFSSSDNNAPPPGGNQPEMTVSELSLALKRVVEGSFEQVRVRGEISGFKRAGSGHLYMALKDENAVLDAVCWRGVAGRLALRPEDGMEVVATGRLTTYPARSRYQIVIESLELAGEGALLKLLEDRRRKLAAEGLFDEARKQSLPFLPEVIGVVTSPTGAVIRDILHRLADRFPRRVLLWPVLVQGEGAAGQVAAAIEGFNRLGPGAALPRPDLLIVARGGGSLEDLWAFNEEVVVRAAASSEIPLISAVGHETDTTLIDFASDRRAPTPTAAAEIAVPVRAELLADVMDYARRMVAGAGRLVEERRVRVEGLGRGLPDPARLLEDKAQRLDDRAERLANAAANVIARRRADLAEWGARLPHPRQQMMLAEGRLAPEGRRLEAAWERLSEALRRELDALGRVLESTSYRTVLKRGFAVVHGPEGPIARAARVAPGMALALEFADGRARARAEGEKSGKIGAKRKGNTRRAGSSNDDSQGTLL
ncbi:MAG: exodeoxyribonuclease VII large subunit [Rhodospirillales bacterium]|nr:exodeoxyribonuclease VII large subunit [Rhodospirillales bacterium]MDH3911842.1 exodeoxyribonuclease VII large subunit [Rhodospirillales bacterium]MDH3919345.1 exodeoxyribonuclease VII large subunit [Rhodospirillales bacterium]MDH3967760.1 exodeoxyribonuclease VII large subunit [Rhodospirillales bacterium]